MHVDAAVQEDRWAPRLGPQEGSWGPGPLSLRGRAPGPRTPGSEGAGPGRTPGSEGAGPGPGLSFNRCPTPRGDAPHPLSAAHL